MVQVSTQDGRQVYTTTRRGSEYMAIQGNGYWTLGTKRIGLTGNGTLRRFDTFAELAASCKAFRGVEG